MKPAHANFRELTVLHRLRDADGSGFPVAHREQLAQSGWFVSTCMRELLVIPGLDSLPNSQSVAERSSHGVEVFRGRHAYAFLLQTVTGLNSSVPGETNVQGQFRKAWRQFSAHGATRPVNALTPVVHRLFDDARLIRADFLQGIGGNSYGSLVRKLLQPAPTDRLLFIGAGDLARSVLPYFPAAQTAVWNRHELPPGLLPEVRRFTPSEALVATNWATHMVVTTPPDAAGDAAWARRAADANLTVVHLGRRRASPGPWQAVDGCMTLDDLFDLRRSLSSVRSLSILRARIACERRAAALERTLRETAPVEGLRLAAAGT